MRSRRPALELDGFEQALEQYPGVASALVEPLFEMSATPVNVVLDDGPVGEKFLVGNVRPLVDMGDQCPDDRVIGTHEARPPNFAAAEMGARRNLLAIQGQRQTAGQPRQHRLVQFGFQAEDA